MVYCTNWNTCYCALLVFVPLSFSWHLITLLWIGLGYGGHVIMLYTVVYYIVILAWAFLYLFSSFQTVLPWASCNNTWNTGTHLHFVCAPTSGAMNVRKYRIKKPLVTNCCSVSERGTINIFYKKNDALFFSQSWLNINMTANSNYFSPISNLLFSLLY